MAYRTSEVLVLSFAVALASCGDDGGSGQTAGESTAAESTTTHGAETSASTGTVDTSSGPVDTSGGSESGGMLDPTPILEREPAISHVCTEVRAMAQAPGATSSRWEGLEVDAGAFVGLRSSQTLELVRVELDGSLGTVLELDAFAKNLSFIQPLTSATGGTIAAVWTRTNGFAEETFRFARADTTPSEVIAPKDVVSGGYMRAAALVPGNGGGYGLLYGAGEASGATQLRFALLDEQGSVVGDAIDVADVGDAYGVVSASAVRASDGGFLVAYAHGEPIDGREVSFIALDPDGHPRGEAKRVSRAADEGWTSELSAQPRPSFVKVGEQYWLAFTEGQIDYEQMTGAVVVRIAILDENGDGDSHLLQAPVEGKNNLWPSFVELGDRIGVTWTTGSIIWICGGCITDYDLQFVLLDPAQVVPASEVVTELHDMNGIMAPLAAVSGNDVLTLGSLDFHALTLPASGQLHCEPQ